MIVHLGVNIKEKSSNYINKELYLSAKPEGMANWTEEHYANQVKKASFNYDLNMAYFDSIPPKKFNKYLDKKVKQFHFKECTDLNNLDGITGIYMMVLDSYKQVYIGKSDNLKKRIKSHWNGSKSLERLIFGDLCSSILSIDSFGALDTTRIFYIETLETFETEQKIVQKFDPGYMLNRTAGGIGSETTYTDTFTSALFSIVANRKNRDFIDFIDINKLQAILKPSAFEFYLSKYPKLKEKYNSTK